MTSGADVCIDMMYSARRSSKCACTHANELMNSEQKNSSLCHLWAGRLSRRLPQNEALESDQREDGNKSEVSLDDLISTPIKEALKVE